MLKNSLILCFLFSVFSSICQETPSSIISDLYAQNNYSEVICYKDAIECVEKSDSVYAQVMYYIGSSIEKVHGSTDAMDWLKMKFDCIVFSYPCLTLYGRLLNESGQYNDAVDVLKKAIALEENLGLHDSDAYVNIRISYAALGDYNQTFIYAQKALNTDLHNQDTAYIIESYVSVGDALTLLAEYKQAEHAFEKALDYIQKSPYKYMFSPVKLGLANIAYYNKDYIKYLTLCKEIYINDSTTHNSLALPFSTSNLAIAYASNKDYDRAIWYENLASQMYQKSNQTEMVLRSKYNLSTHYYYLKNYRQSVLSSKESYTLSKKINNLDFLQKSSEILAKNFNHLKLFDSAYYYLHESKTLSDSIYNIEKMKVSEELTKKYQLAENQNNILEKELRISELSKRNIIYFTIGILMVVFLAFTYVFWRIKYRKIKDLHRTAINKVHLQAQNLKISLGLHADMQDVDDISDIKNELEYINESLFHRINSLKSDNYLLSHELKHGLRGLKNSMHFLAENSTGEQKASAYSSLDRIKNLEQFVNKFLQSAEVLNLPITTSKVSLTKLINDVVDAIGIQKKYLTVHQEISEDIEVDYILLKHVLYNLIENGYRYAVTQNNNKAAIHVQSTMQNDTIIITICDNGPGIDQHILPSLYQLFNKKSSSDGHGLGLYTAKKLTEKLGGRLDLIRNSSSGCCFEVQLPLAINKAL